MLSCFIYHYDESLLYWHLSIFLTQLLISLDKIISHSLTWSLAFTSHRVLILVREYHKLFTTHDHKLITSHKPYRCKWSPNLAGFSTTAKAESNNDYWKTEKSKEANRPLRPRNNNHCLLIFSPQIFAAENELTYTILLQLGWWFTSSSSHHLP